jgi:hypothetical protein
MRSAFSSAPKLATIECIQCHTVCDVTFGPKAPDHLPLRCICGEPLPNEAVLIANIMLAQQETIAFARILGACMAGAAGAMASDPTNARRWNAVLRTMNTILDESIMSRPLAAFSQSLMMADPDRRDER